MAVKVETASGKWNLTSRTQLIATRLPLPIVASMSEVARREGVTVTEIVKRAVDRELRILSSDGTGAGATVG